MEIGDILKGLHLVVILKGCAAMNIVILTVNTLRVDWVKWVYLLQDITSVSSVSPTPARYSQELVSDKVDMLRQTHPVHTVVVFKRLVHLPG